MPYKNFMTEVLSAHAEQKLGHQNYAQLFPGNKDLPVLLSLADKIRNALEPVSAPPSFTDKLHQDLVAAALQKNQHNKKSDGIVVASPIFLSAIVSALLVLSSIFFFVRKQNVKQKVTA